MSLKLRVVSTNLETKEVELDKIIDHDNRNDRVWLGKHCYWAFRNGRSVSTTPIETGGEE